ncbi:hypothetical protein SEEM202_18882, partial [Salmonella enterica subsp. enterica serovar Montevideo str. 515920-2]
MWLLALKITVAEIPLILIPPPTPDNGGDVTPPDNGGNVTPPDDGGDDN